MTSMPHASPVMSTALHPGARPGHARTLDLADLLGAQTPRPELAADLTILEAFLRTCSAPRPLALSLPPI